MSSFCPQGGRVKWVKCYFIILCLGFGRKATVSETHRWAARKHPGTKVKYPGKDNELMSKSLTWATWTEPGLMVQKCSHSSCELEQQLDGRKRKTYICSVWTRHSSAHERFNLQCKRHISGGQQPMCVWYQGKRVGAEIRGTKIKVQWINSRIGRNKLFYVQSYQKRLWGCLISILLKDISTHRIMVPTSPPEPQPSPRTSWAEHQKKKGGISILQHNWASVKSLVWRTTSFPSLKTS